MTSSKDMLQRLGSGESIDSVSADRGFSRQDFNRWWDAQINSRLPEVESNVMASVDRKVDIVRDRWGIPHIFAQGDDDLFFGYGFAIAQDRLWQLDYLRRKAMGRLSEVLGKEALDQDVLVRTVGINRIAREEVERLPASTIGLLNAFSAGINLAIEQGNGKLPIEFGLLGYEPEPWTPLDSVAIWGEFRWYLTGRLPVIVIPEVAKRTLGDGSLYRAFLTPEAGDESILPPGSYPAGPVGPAKVEATAGGPDEGLGSNNWVVAGGRTTTNKPMLASDPHIAFGSVGCWHEVHLSGGSFDSVGMAYVGVPFICMGRNRRVAWGLTNNICSQRDLYQEMVDPEHPDAFLYDGRWEPAREVTESIDVRGAETVVKTIRYSRNGPIVDEILPKECGAQAVSLRWMGAEECDEISAMLMADSAESADEFREALRGWRVPTWSFGFADAEGHIGYQCAGQIPIREDWDRSFRPGWDAAHQWGEVIPYDSMPALKDPDDGWIRSANNRTAQKDFPFPLSGTWSSGHRAVRIRQMIEAKERLSRDDFARMQMDALSLRAIEGVPPLLETLEGSPDARVRAAAALLVSWNRRMEPSEAGATIFEYFFQRWSTAVSGERFGDELTGLVSGAVSGLALALLSKDEHGWFSCRDRKEAIVGSLIHAMDDLERDVGTDMSRWEWGKVHKITLRHHLSGRGDLSHLLDRGGHPVRGNGVTVCNTGYDPNYLAVAGANYRLIADLQDDPPGLWAVDAAGESGHPGSPHYGDQLAEWMAGRHHYLPLERDEIRAESTQMLQPK